MRRDLDLARRGGGGLPGPRDVRARVQPVPLRRVPPVLAATTSAPVARPQRRDYRRKLSGPIADRIDITRFVEPIKPTSARCPFDRPETSAEVRVRVTAARERQRERYAGTAVAAQRAGARVRCCARLAADRRRDAAPRRGGVRRPAHPTRCRPGAPGGLVGRRPGRDTTGPGVDELDVALRLRSAAPLLLESIPRSITAAERMSVATRRRRRSASPGWCSRGSASRATRG